MSETVHWDPRYSTTPAQRERSRASYPLAFLVPALAVGYMFQALLKPDGPRKLQTRVER